MFTWLKQLFELKNDSKSRAVPNWIQYSEPLAGENSPTYSDVLNRAVKDFWQNFLVRHDEDGLHTVPIPSQSEIDDNTAHRARTDNPHSVTAAQVGALVQADLDAHNVLARHYIPSEIDHQLLSGHGTQTHAQIDAHINNNALHGGSQQYVMRTYSGSPSPSYGAMATLSGDLTDMYEGTELAIGFYGQIEPYQPVGNECSLFKRQGQDGNLIFEFGCDCTDYKLFFRVYDGAAVSTYKSLGVCMDPNFSVPYGDETYYNRFFGVQVDRANNTICFFYNGIVEANQAAANHWRQGYYNEVMSLGYDSDYTMQALFTSGALLVNPGTRFFPPSVGKSQLPWGLQLWIPDGTSTLTDQFGWANLPVINGTQQVSTDILR